MFTSNPPAKPKTPENPSYLVVEANKHGKDYIVADLHGQMELFENILAMLGPNDRLFISGDMIDRGPHSYKIVERIIKINKEREKLGMPPKIHVCLGNHERMFLKYFHEKDPHILHGTNGGSWILNLHKLQQKKLADYFIMLPYIIKVKSKHAKPFYVVHAELPLPDDELRKNIAQNTPLDPESAHHAIWARSDKFKKLKRSKNAPIVYCGHNIAGGPRDNHHENLDTGAYTTGGTIVVAHDTHEATLVKCSTFDNNFEYPLELLRKQIQTSLDLRNQPEEATLNLPAMATKSREAKARMNEAIAIHDAYDNGKELSKIEREYIEDLIKLPNRDLHVTINSSNQAYIDLLPEYEKIAELDKTQKTAAITTLHKKISNLPLKFTKKIYQTYISTLEDEYQKQNISFFKENPTYGSEDNVRERISMLKQFVKNIEKMERIADTLKNHLDVLQQIELAAKENLELDSPRYPSSNAASKLGSGRETSSEISMVSLPSESKLEPGGPTSPTKIINR